MGDVRLLLRVPLWSRLWWLVFPSVWTGVVVVFLVRDGAVGVVDVASAAFGILLAWALGYRSISEQLRLEGECLLVRNLLATHRLHRNDIKRIWIGSPVTAPLPGGWTYPVGEAINIEPTRGKPFTVDVSHEFFGLLGAGERLKDVHQALIEWKTQPGSGDHPR